MFRLAGCPFGRLIAVLFTAAVVLAVASPVALADQRQCQVVHNLMACVAVHDPPPSHSSSGPRPGPGTCSWRDREYTCYDNLLGWFDSQDGCYYKLASPQPPYDPRLWKGHPDGQGAVYRGSCAAIAWFGYVWRPSAPDGLPTKSSAQLAQQAIATLTLPMPVPPTSPSGGKLPDGRPYTVVRVPTWFWTTPASYQVRTARAAVGQVWAQVTVTPVALTFAPGNSGRTATCPGPGKVWTPEVGPWAHAPGGCDYSYPRSTYGYPGGELTATYGIVWRATWVGSGGTGGGFPDVTTSATSQFAVAEAQAVIVK
jgi:hypothetical protein